VVSVAWAQRDMLDGAELVVAGGPTHIHGMSSWRTRKRALESARQPGRALVMDVDADGPGLREWLDGLGQAGGRVAAFDTRLDGPAAFTGRASKAIARPAYPEEPHSRTHYRTRAPSIVRLSPELAK
jgi:hypothetical protein